MNTLAFTVSPSRATGASTSVRRLLRRGAAALGALVIVSPLMAATTTPAEQAASQRARSSGSPEQVYQQYRADCLAGRTHQDRATCLREAGAALQEARRGGLESGSSSTWQQNALQRCQRQPAEERAACERLARGEGTTSGSVEGGGVIKEVVTRTVGPTPAPAPTPSR